jgi:Fe-S cluster assembly ATP-binding protein
MLEIKNLHVTVQGAEILKGIDLKINNGEVHAIMGPNGSGKSTLTRVIAGHSDYVVTQGTVSYRGKNALEMAPEVRAREGVFLAFQYPIELPGVSNAYFLRSALNEVRVAQGLGELDAVDFLGILKEKMKLVEMDASLSNRFVNDGFSGGEKKRNEILQMLILQPKLCVLDETDSGLDIDALKVVSNGVNQMRGMDRSILLVTHYQRLLNYVKPDFVHVLMNGRIVKSGSSDLALSLEEKGYDWVREPAKT